MTGRDPHADAKVPRPRAGEGTLPKAPVDDAAAAGGTSEMTPGAAGGDSERYATGRRDPEKSGRGEAHPPHVTENDSSAGLQDEHESTEDVPVLPANASGEDMVSTDDQPTEVRDESAYDQRPEEDKSWSSRDP